MSELVRDPSEVALLAAEKEDENWAFRAWLKRRYGYDDEGLMSVVRDLADYVSSEIDCTECANCCRQLDTYLSDEDIERLARALDKSISIHRIESTFVCPIVFNVVEGMKDVLRWRS